MKFSSKTKQTWSQRNEGRGMTLGELISATYNACGEQQAPRILQLAVDSQLIRFKRPCM